MFPMSRDITRGGGGDLNLRPSGHERTDDRPPSCAVVAVGAAQGLFRLIYCRSRGYSSVAVGGVALARLLTRCSADSTPKLVGNPIDRADLAWIAR